MGMRQTIRSRLRIIHDNHDHDNFDHDDNALKHHHNHNIFDNDYNRPRNHANTLVQSLKRRLKPRSDSQLGRIRKLHNEVDQQHGSS
ncbi:Uncharacterised protein [uncultured archaeon]|nr:Uncharacterised protein [uncultured archaeon]